MSYRVLRLKYLYRNSHLCDSPLAQQFSYPLLPTSSFTRSPPRSRQTFSYAESYSSKGHQSSSTSQTDCEALETNTRWRKVSSGPTPDPLSHGVSPYAPPNIIKDIPQADGFDGLVGANNEGSVSTQEIAHSDVKVDPRKDLFSALWRTAFTMLYPPSPEKQAQACDELLSERAELKYYLEQGRLEQLEEGLRPFLSLWSLERRPRLLAAALTDSASATLRLLNTLQIPFRQFHVTMDCLLYIQRAYEHELSSSTYIYQMFKKRLFLMFEIWKEPLCCMKFRHFALFLEHLSVEQIENLLERTSDDSPLEPKVLLALTDFYTRHQQVELALAQLASLPPAMLTASEPLLLQRCTNLLKLDSVEVSENQQNFKILPKILELGIIPDVPIYNLTIQNACAAGISGVGWDLYRHMLSEGVGTNAQTYLALLIDSFKRKDVQCLNEVLTAIHHNEDLARNPWLACCTMNIVRLVCRFARKDRPHVALSHMMAIYDRAFSRATLHKLGLLSPSSDANGSTELPEPGSETLGHIIRLFVLNSTSRAFVSRLWTNLLELLVAEDSQTLEAARSPVFYDGFVLFYSRSVEQVGKCLEVVQQMLHGGLCQPTSRTWTILVHALLKHGQYETARRVHKLMTTHNLVPEGEIWAKITNKYPKLQLTSESAAYLDSVERKMRLPGLAEPEGSSTRDEQRTEIDGERDDTAPLFLTRAFQEMVDLRNQPG